MIQRRAEVNIISLTKPTPTVSEKFLSIAKRSFKQMFLVLECKNYQHQGTG